MAIISVRLSAEEEKMVSFLSRTYNKDKSSLLRYSLKEMYESLVDNGVVDRFEEKEAESAVSFMSAEDILESI